jgi:hypothetical protein
VADPSSGVVVFIVMTPVAEERPPISIPPAALAWVAKENAIATTANILIHILFMICVSPFDSRPQLPSP